MHKIDFRIYYEDTDAGGIVFYANYLKFAERARTEWLRGLGFSQSNLELLFVVRRVQIDYLAPARLDDVITVESALQNISRSSITMNQIVKSGEILLAEMEVLLVCVDKTMKPVRIPNDIKQKITGEN